MAEKEGLAKIVGDSNVLDDEATLGKYARDESFVPPGKPWAVVKPANADEIRGVVQWANDNMTPLIPVSSPGGPRFRGDTIPSQGGVITR